MTKYDPDTDWNQPEDQKQYPDASYVVTDVISTGGGGIKKYECATRSGASIVLKNKYNRPRVTVDIIDSGRNRHVFSGEPYSYSYDWVEMVFRVPDSIVFADGVDRETEVSVERMRLRSDPVTLESEVRNTVNGREQGETFNITDFDIPYDDPRTVQQLVIRWLTIADRPTSSIGWSEIGRADQTILDYLDGNVDEETANEQFDSLKEP